VKYAVFVHTFQLYKAYSMPVVVVTFVRFTDIEIVVYRVSAKDRYQMIVEIDEKDQGHELARTGIIGRGLLVIDEGQGRVIDGVSGVVLQMMSEARPKNYLQNPLSDMYA